MIFSIMDDNGEKVVLVTDNENVKIEGKGYIYDIVKSIIDKKEIKKIGESDNFPEHLKRVNEKGVMELKTESYEYLAEYLPKLCGLFGLTVRQEA